MACGRHVWGQWLTSYLLEVADKLSCAQRGTGSSRRVFLAMVYLPVSQFAQNDTTSNETARLSLIGILSPDSRAVYVG